jgi:hypothetical protein
MFLGRDCYRTRLEQQGDGEVFVIVWNGIFEAIKLITGKLLNVKVFSKTSSLLCAIGDSKERRHKASVMSLFCVR